MIIEVEVKREMFERRCPCHRAALVWLDDQPQCSVSGKSLMVWFVVDVGSGEVVAEAAPVYGRGRRHRPTRETSDTSTA